MRPSSPWRRISARPYVWRRLKAGRNIFAAMAVAPVVAMAVALGVALVVAPDVVTDAVMAAGKQVPLDEWSDGGRSS